MKQLTPSLLSGILLLVSFHVPISSLYGAEPADNDIKNALYDINRYEQQYGAAITGSKPAINRTLNLLKIAREKLDASQNKDHESWKEADERYQKLVNHLNALLHPGASPSSSHSTPNPTPSTTQTAKAAASPSSGASQLISQQRVRIKKLYRDIESVIQTVNQAGALPLSEFRIPGKIHSISCQVSGLARQIRRFHRRP